MVFVSSAVLGAAAGTGLALLVAVTIVMYRYYVVRRKGKEWAELDRLEEKKAARKINLQQECSVISGSHPVQPPSSVPQHGLVSECGKGGPLEVSSSPLQPNLEQKPKPYSSRQKPPPPSASRNNSTESVHSRASKSHSPGRLRTFSLEGRLPLAYEPDGRVGSKESVTSVFSVNPRDINSPKKRNSTVSCATLPRHAEIASVPDSPSGSIRSDSTRSPRRRVPIIMAANDINTVLGRFHLRLQYDGAKEELMVHLVEAQELISLSEGGFRDPYLLDYDRFSRDEVIGEIRFLLNTLDLSGCEIWGDLIAVKKPTEQSAELLISLSYLPQAERLTVVVMKAKNLHVVHEPFVKLYLIVNDKRAKKRKTSAIRAADPSNPIWNEAFTFDLPASQLQDAGVELFVTSNEGETQEPGCAVGLQEGGSGSAHWQDLMQNSRKPIAMWHTLR
ncbi:hypothetical protein pipiens_004357 [Culex pipiens pipiens]|uniref:C2 domain-containing protein n=1 Tax=Culex pipiens pipiens TaxID=38569 RepID=A0ABD1CJG8_CULPP